MDPILFPITDYWWSSAGFIAFTLAMLALDLGVFHRKAHVVGFREATIWSVVWVALAIAFGYILYQYGLWKFPRDPRLLALPGFDPEGAARKVALEYLTGYVVEKSNNRERLNRQRPSTPDGSR